MTAVAVGQIPAEAVVRTAVESAEAQALAEAVAGTVAGLAGIQTLGLSQLETPRCSLALG